jgi:hypothetical protein
MMRTLFYVSIIRPVVDLDAVAHVLDRQSLENIGENIWLDDLRTTDGYWDALSLYFDSIIVFGAKIFQDGMVADGEAGSHIIREGERKGSKNHCLVSKLLRRGAILMKTEDLSLVKKERERLLKINRAKTAAQKLLSLTIYNLSKKMLLKQRDESIAQRIDNGLAESETGILFIGADHNVKPKLPRDIKIKEIKETRKIKDYQSLLPFYQKSKKRFEDLSGYLVGKIGNDVRSSAREEKSSAFGVRSEEEESSEFGVRSSE